jgi:hypothetical protein
VAERGRECRFDVGSRASSEESNLRPSGFEWKRQ